MKDQLQYHGTISSYGVAIKQYTYKNLSICVSNDDDSMVESKNDSGIKNFLHVSFDCRTTGKIRNADMLYCAERLGIDASKSFLEYDIPSTNPLTPKRMIHYYEQAV